MLDLVREEEMETGLLISEATEVQERSVNCQACLWESACVHTRVCRGWGWGLWQVEYESGNRSTHQTTHVHTKQLTSWMLLILWFPQGSQIKNYWKSKCAIVMPYFSKFSKHEQRVNTVLKSGIQFIIIDSGDKYSTIISDMLLCWRIWN